MRRGGRIAVIAVFIPCKSDGPGDLPFLGKGLYLPAHTHPVCTCRKSKGEVLTRKPSVPAGGGDANPRARSAGPQERGRISGAEDGA